MFSVPAITITHRSRIIRNRKFAGRVCTVAASHLLSLAAAAASGDGSSVMLVNVEQLQCLDCSLDNRLQAGDKPTVCTFLCNFWFGCGHVCAPDTALQ